MDGRTDGQMDGWPQGSFWSISVIAVMLMDSNLLYHLTIFPLNKKLTIFPDKGSFEKNIPLIY